MSSWHFLHFLKHISSNIVEIIIHSVTFSDKKVFWLAQMLSMFYLFHSQKLDCSIWVQYSVLPISTLTLTTSYQYTIHCMWISKISQWVSLAWELVHAWWCMWWLIVLFLWFTWFDPPLHATAGLTRLWAKFIPKSFLVLSRTWLLKMK